MFRVARQMLFLGPHQHVALHFKAADMMGIVGMILFWHDTLW